MANGNMAREGLREYVEMEEKPELGENIQDASFRGSVFTLTPLWMTSSLVFLGVVPVSSPVVSADSRGGVSKHDPAQAVSTWYARGACVPEVLILRVKVKHRLRTEDVLENA